MRLQRTIKKEVAFHGIGVHTGKEAKVMLKPAARDTGIVFFRVDRGVIIRATLSAVRDTTFATTLGVENVRVRTVEHLLATISGLGIDNLMIEIEGPEVPIMDGSAAGLVGLILEAGIAKQGKVMPILDITKPVHYEDAHSKVFALPYEGRRISYRIHLNHAVFKEQELSVEITEESFVKELAAARTYGFLKDVETLRANGLAKGGSLDNAVVIGDQGILNGSGLRFNDEFVRHKMLDSIGDLSLIGFPMQGHFIFEKSGHTTNINFLRKLITEVDSYRLLTGADHFDRQALIYR